MSDTLAPLQIGDIITFPMHESSEAILTGPCSVMMTQGVPGLFRVTDIDADGNVCLEKVEEVAIPGSVAPPSGVGTRPTLVRTPRS